MEENQLSQNVESVTAEPEKSLDNSANLGSSLSDSKADNGQSVDPSKLILGKFKSTEDLTKAYQQLEKLQGTQSSELGSLREKVTEFNSANSLLGTISRIFEHKDSLQEASQKYSEYFSDPSFRKLAGEAYLALGDNFDPEKLVNLVESYVSARIFAYEKSKTAKNETQQAVTGMKFDKNDKNSKTNVKKSIQQMTPKELDALLDELI